jgi:hypothetical protein
MPPEYVPSVRPAASTRSNCASSSANGDLFRLHQRNQRAFEQLADNERHQAENEDLEQRFRRFLANPAIPLEDRVRMSCSIGAALTPLVGATEGAIFGDVSTDEVVGYVREVVRDLFSATRRRGR